MLRSTILAILLVSPLGDNAQAMNLFSALMPFHSEVHSTAGPTLAYDSQPDATGSQTYHSSEAMPVSLGFAHDGYGQGGEGCESCGSNYGDLWAGYCSKKHGHRIGGHHKKCCQPKCRSHKCHRPKCHGDKCCGMSHLKAKCHSCWGHLSHWFHKSLNCSSHCSSNCGNHESGHYDGEIMESEGELIPAPMEDASPSDRKVHKSASLKLLPPSLRLWPIAFGL